jgi:hypothetical protein
MAFRIFLAPVCALLFYGLRAEGFAYGDAAPAWTGTFVYQGLDGYDGGGTAATGDPIVLDMTLKIAPDGACILKADGFQTDETLNCQTVALPESYGIDIRFAGFPPGAMEANAFFTTSYAPSTLLFSLLPAQQGHGVITHWDAIKPATAKSDEGMFFERKP